MVYATQAVPATTNFPRQARARKDARPQGDHWPAAPGLVYFW